MKEKEVENKKRDRGRRKKEEKKLKEHGGKKARRKGLVETNKQEMGK